MKDPRSVLMIERGYILFVCRDWGRLLPQQDSAQDKMSILAKFCPAVESCSKKLSPTLTSDAANFTFILHKRGNGFDIAELKYSCTPKGKKFKEK